MELRTDYKVKSNIIAVNFYPLLKKNLNTVSKKSLDHHCLFKIG